MPMNDPSPATTFRHGLEARATGTALPTWAADLVTLYAGGAVNQFVLHGNVADRMLLPVAPAPRLGTLQQFVLDVLMPRFDVVLSYDLGNGVRVVKGGQIFTKWPNFKEGEP